MPAIIHHLLGIGVDVNLLDLQRINFVHLMLDHAAAHIRAIFHRVTVNRHLARQPQFFFKTALGAVKTSFASFRVRAAGIGPKAGGVIFAQGAALQQGFRTAHDENRHGFMPQSAQMGLQLFNRLQLTVYPCGNQDVHSFCPCVLCTL